MINNIKFLLKIYKDNKKQIFKIKIGFFLIINIFLFIYIFIYFVHSLFVSGVTASKYMSEALLEANKKGTTSNIDTLDNMLKQIIVLNDNNNKIHEYTLNVEKNIGDRIIKLVDLFIEYLNEVKIRKYK